MNEIADDELGDSRLDEDEEEEEDDGEDLMSQEDSYGSEDFMEGNEDLSSNRDQSFADQDMLADELEGDGDEDDFGEDSFGSSVSDYDDEDSSALIEIPMQNLIPAKGNGSAVDNQSAAGPSNPFDIIFESRPSRDANDGDAGAIVPPSDSSRQLEPIPEAENADGGQGDQESYYSVEE